MIHVAGSFFLRENEKDDKDIKDKNRLLKSVQPVFVLNVFNRADVL